jgi:predicted DCC family thiol-disulfide oxidoreductase YuxK
MSVALSVRGKVILKMTETVNVHILNKIYERVRNNGYIIPGQYYCVDSDPLKIEREIYFYT